MLVIEDITQIIDLLAVSVAKLYNKKGVEDIREMLIEKIRQLIEKIEG